MLSAILESYTLNRPAPRVLQGLSRLRLPAALTTETLAVLACVFFMLVSNGAFWQAVMAGRSWGSPSSWGFALAVFVMLAGGQFALLGLVLTRRTVKPVLMLLFVGTAFASHFMHKYGTVLDANMLRNVLHTNWKEARELLSGALLWQLAWQAALPCVLLARVKVVPLPWRRSLLRRAIAVGAALAAAVVALLLVFQDFGSLMRNQKEIRYLITPGNYVYSMLRVAHDDMREKALPRQPIGLDAHLAPSWQSRNKPVLFVLVVGETVRAANWGLDGYERQTTPELSAIGGLLNFASVQSCGTDTETSVPCMFSPWGRRQYDEARIRGHQSLLHVLDHAGFKVQWRDNQSGCKGVCEGLQMQATDAARSPGLCSDGLCLDEAMLQGLDGVAQDGKGNLFIVLHQLGNHGPAYHRRYPPEFRRYSPTCDTSELSKCAREEIVNSYDNAVLYTDHFLAKTIDFLRGQSAKYDTAMIYVSDHGESLGESHLYLHGVPYAIAPDVQTHVPMVAWFSQGYAHSFGLDLGCLAQRSHQSAAHDNLFHTVLGVLDVQTSVREPAMDLTAGCRS